MEKCRCSKCRFWDREKIKVIGNELRYTSNDKEEIIVSDCVLLHKTTSEDFECALGEVSAWRRIKEIVSDSFEELGCDDTAVVSIFVLIFSGYALHGLVDLVCSVLSVIFNF